MQKFFYSNFFFFILLLSASALLFGCVGGGEKEKPETVCSSVCPSETIQAAFPDCRCMGVWVNETTNQTEYYYIKEECSANCEEWEEQMPFPDCACLPKEENKSTEANETIIEAPKTIAWKQLYELNKIQSYTYKKRVAEANKTTDLENVKVNASIVLLNGKNVLLLEARDGRVWSEWREQNFFECMKRTERKNYFGEKIEEEQPCPTSNVYWNYFVPGYNASVQLKEIERKTVNASVGVVSVVVFEVSGIEGVQVWKANNIPIPVKITNNVTKVEVELISYS